MQQKTPPLVFLGVLDSILLEIVYDNDEKRLKGKLEASWTVFGEVLHINDHTERDVDI